MVAQRNYAVSPGSYLKEWLEDEGITQQVAAARIGVARKTVNQIVRGGNISPDLAVRLGRATPIDADVWLRIQAQYEGDLARIRQEQELSQHAHKIPKPVRSFLKVLGFNADGRNPGQLVSEFLTFHGCGTWEAFEEFRGSASQADFALAFRTETKKSALEPMALATWLRACDTAPEMETIADLEYSESILRDMLPELKRRASSPDPSMFDDLSAMLREAGVVLTRHEAPTSFPLHGVTRWVRGVPVIHQTCRQRRDGFIIFTLFHELGHVLNDPIGELHLDDVEAKGKKSASEQAADKFAMDLLIPPEDRGWIRDLEYDRDLRHAASRLEISPGLLVFHLHRTQALPRHFGNRLLVEV